MSTCSRFLNFDNANAQTRIQIKVCGITREEDAIGVSRNDIQAVGLIFYDPSSRHLSCEQAKRIRKSLPDFVSAVAVVVDPTDERLQSIVEIVKPDFIQFHGDESPNRCKEPGLPYIKALRVRSSSQIEQAARDYSEASALLLDTYVPEKVGGTGLTFSWNLVPNLDMPLILAGGLRANNVAAAIDRIQPSAVDVSTGVESSPGIKNLNAVHHFVQIIREFENRKHVA